MLWLRPATILKETVAKVLSCEFCKISKSIFFHRTPLVTVSVFFKSFLIVLTQFSFWQEKWPLGYDSMRVIGFLCSKPLGGFKVDSDFHLSEEFLAT